MGQPKEKGKTNGLVGLKTGGGGILRKGKKMNDK